MGNTSHWSLLASTNFPSESAFLPSFFRDLKHLFFPFYSELKVTWRRVILIEACLLTSYEELWGRFIFNKYFSISAFQAHNCKPTPAFNICWRLSWDIWLLGERDLGTFLLELQVLYLLQSSHKQEFICMILVP